MRKKETKANKERIVVANVVLLFNAHSTGAADEMSSVSTAGGSLSDRGDDDGEGTAATDKQKVEETVLSPTDAATGPNLETGASSDASAAPPARKPRTVFNLLRSPVEHDVPVSAPALAQSEELVADDQRAERAPTPAMMRVDTLERVEQYLLQNPVETETGRPDDDDVVSTASSATYVISLSGIISCKIADASLRVPAANECTLWVHCANCYISFSLIFTSLVLV